VSKGQPDPIIDKLNTLIKITTASAFKEESKEGRILILLNLGIQRKEVAEILGTTVKYVDKVKYEARKKEDQKKKQKGGKSKTIAQQPKENVERHDE
jgi:hypothetical protein